MKRTTTFFLLALVLSSSADSSAQLCGDCDQDGVTPTVRDALEAARIGVGLVVATAGQLIACEVDGVAPVSVVDALRIAQAAVGLPVTLRCAPAPPTFAGMHVDPVSVVFVLDRSASVVWSSSSFSLPSGAVVADGWEAQQVAVGEAIAAMPQTTLFDIVCFNHSFEQWSGTLVPATPANQAAATAFVNSLSASGGTAPVTPFAMAVSVLAGPPAQILFATRIDTSPAAFPVVEVTAAVGGQSRIDVVAFDSTAAGQAALLPLATMNGGTLIAVP